MAAKAATCVCVKIGEFLFCCMADSGIYYLTAAEARAYPKRTAMALISEIRSEFVQYCERCHGGAWMEAVRRQRRPFQFVGFGES